MKCNWTKRAQNEYQRIVDYILNEFGKMAALNFVDDIELWDSRIAENPEIGAIEPLLAERKRFKYHSFIVSKHNKFIYTISKDRSVTIADIWDMRRHPDNLAKRIKTK